MKHSLKYFADSPLRMTKATYKKISLFVNDLSLQLGDASSAFSFIDKANKEQEDQIFARVTAIVSKAIGRDYQREEFDELFIAIKSRNKKFENSLKALLTKFK